MENQVRIVEAIDEGRIVKVPEDYARREGLLILRKPVQASLEERHAQIKARQDAEEKQVYGLDRFRKPLRYKQNDIIGSLVDHFHWDISRCRKMRGLSRKQLSNSLGCNENALKLLENGIMPSNDYILINKIEKFFGISLRKDGQPYHASMRELAMSGRSETAGEEKREERAEKRRNAESLIGSDIEVID